MVQPRDVGLARDLTRILDRGLGSPAHPGVAVGVGVAPPVHPPPLGVFMGRTRGGWSCRYCHR